MVFATILSGLAPSFLMVALGGLIRARLSENAWQGLDKLNFEILFPALLFVAASKRPIEISEVLQIGPAVWAIIVVAMLLGWAARPIGPERFLDFAGGWQTVWRFNSAIALVASQTIGPDTIGEMAVAIGMAVPVANMLAVIVLSRGGSLSVFQTISKVVLNPFLLASVLGVAVGLSGVSKSAVSKHVSSLEARLGARLLNRTTRRVSPTEIGLAYYDRARRVLNDAGEADALVTSMQSAPSGLLRISVATDFGVNHLSPVLSDFLAAYPDITVNMVLNNRYVELISEGFDVAVRIGELEDSTLRARKLTETVKRMVAAPSYIEKFGRPQKIDDLNEHKLLHYSSQSSGNVWRLTAPSGEKRQVRTAGWLSVNDGQSLLNAAISGLGIAYLPSYLYAEALKSGAVLDAMPSLPDEVQGIYAVYPPGRFTQPKVRAFIDFLVQSFAEKGLMDWVD